jgi:hypothetical protein
MRRYEMLKAVKFVLLSLILAGIFAGPAFAQPDPGDDPNEYANTDVFTTPVISEAGCWTKTAILPTGSRFIIRRPRPSILAAGT